MLWVLPLVRAGCIVDIDPAGNVINFIYDGVKKPPHIPTPLISKEKLIEHVQNRLDFRLKIVNLYTAFHNVSEDGLCLVYDPEPYFMKYKADALQPTLMIEREDDGLETYVSLPAPSNAIVRKDVPFEEIVGITEQMEVIREVDVGEETGIVWRDGNWKMDEKDLSMDGFFIRQTEMLKALYF